MKDIPGRPPRNYNAVAVLILTVLALFIATAAVTNLQGNARCRRVKAAHGFDICVAQPTEYNFFDYVCACGYLQTIYEPTRSTNE